MKALWSGLTCSTSANSSSVGGNSATVASQTQNDSKAMSARGIQDS